MMPLLGRDELLASLEERLADGQTVLVYGCLGIGKTALLLELERRARLAGRPCGRAERTEQLSDVTRALQRAYPDVGAGIRKQRHLRGVLRLAVERQRGSLLLDHLGDVGNALKGFLRSMQGTGLGVLIAADVEHPRDHARIRARGLAYREVKIPPLHGRYMRRLLEERLANGELPHPVSEEDRAVLLEIASGRPGVIGMLMERLKSGDSWRDGRLRPERLRLDVTVAIGQVYIRTISARAARPER